MNDIIKIFALGGLSENGKNLYVVEINNDIFVLDAGMKYPDIDAKGIDLILPDFTYLKNNKERVKGYILSHAHDDVIGAMNYLVKDVPAPIYASPITQFLLQKSNIKYGTNADLVFVTIKPTQEFFIASRRFIAYRTTHSIWDCFGIAIETSQGYIIYTGDYIFDYGALPHYATDLKTLSQLASKEVLCLLADSTDAQNTGSASPNHKLTPHIERVFQENRGRIFISLYNNNMFGISEAVDLAIKYGKKILFYSRDTQMTIAKAIELGVMNIPNGTLISFDDANKYYPEGIVIFITGGGTRVFKSLGKLAGGDDNDKKITLRPNDKVILAANYVPGNEIIAIKAINDVYRTGASVVDLKRKKIAGMHPHAEDIKLIISLLKPKYYMPVKGEFSRLIANAQLAMSLGYNHSNILVYDNGDVARFENKRLIVTREQMPTGDLLVDGLGVGDVGSVVISDREKLSNEGILVIATSIDRVKRKIVTSVDTQSRGLVFVKDSEKVLQDATEIFVNTLEEALDRGGKMPDFQAVKINIRDKILRLIKRELGKEPMILPVIIEL